MAIISGVAQWAAGFFAPDDGYARNAGAIQVGLAALADRTAYLYSRIIEATGLVNVGNLEVVNDAFIGDALDVQGSFSVAGNASIPNITGNSTVSGTMTAGNVATGGNVAATSGQVSASTMLAANGYHVPTRSVTIAIDGPVEAESGWAVVHSGNNTRWETTAADSTARFLRVCLNQYIPPNASITQVVARYKGANGHSELPDTMPELVLYRKQIGTGGAGSGNVGSKVDDSADTTAYQAEHDIPLTLGSPYTPDTSTGSIYALLWSEADADDDAIVGALFLGLLVTFTFSRIDRV